MSGGDGVGAGVGVTMLVAQGEGRSPGHGFKSPQPDHVGSSQVKTRTENVQNQNSGSAATDTLLWRIGVSCHNLTRLVIGGTEVHGKISGRRKLSGDRPGSSLALRTTVSQFKTVSSGQVRVLENLGQELKSPSRFSDGQDPSSRNPSPLCFSLTQLKTSGCLGMGAAGLRVVWKCLKKLQLLQVQETLIG